MDELVPGLRVRTRCCMSRFDHAMLWWLPVDVWTSGRQNLRLIHDMLHMNMLNAFLFVNVIFPISDETWCDCNLHLSNSCPSFSSRTGEFMAYMTRMYFTFIYWCAQTVLRRSARWPWSCIPMQYVPTSQHRTSVLSPGFGLAWAVCTHSPVSRSSGAATRTVEKDHAGHNAGNIIVNLGAVSRKGINIMEHWGK